jgi:hypothetical protein
MAGISNSDLIDLQRTTLENLPDLDFEVALDYQNYLIVNQWFKNEKVQAESGTSIKRNIILDDSGTAQHVRLYQKTAIGVADVQSQITAPWVQVQSHYVIERREALRNRAPARYIELLKSRRVDGLVSLANLLERTGWGTPASPSDDLNPRGLSYWLSKAIPPAGAGYNAAIDSVANGGGFVGRRIRFGGGIGAGGTDVLTDKGGINPTAESRWRNYADVYASVSTSDLVRKLRRAFHATSFQSPMLAKDLESGPKSNFKIYTNLSTLTQLEELVQSQNVGSEKLGPDLAAFHGVTAFRRVPLLYAPVLDSDTSDPVYGVNHAKFFPIVQEGDWLRESEPMMDVETHNVIVTFIDGSYQYFCTNVREAGFVIHKALAD